MAEWLSRETRNLIPSGAQVRILLASFFCLVEACADGIFGINRATIAVKG